MKKIIIAAIILVVAIFATWCITMLTLQVDNTSDGTYITSFRQTDVYN